MVLLKEGDCFEISGDKVMKVIRVLSGDMFIGGLVYRGTIGKFISSVGIYSSDELTEEKYWIKKIDTIECAYLPEKL